MQQDLDSTWDAVCTELRAEVTDFTFHIWLEPLRLIASSGPALTVHAPGHIRSWVSERYDRVLREAATRALGRPAQVEIVGEDWAPEISPDLALHEAPLDEDRLNPKYTFEQFVISDGNRFAHAAALAVAEMPAQAYNPLFIYGNPGLGKTHLLHAIGNYVRRYGGGLRVRYATAEAFTGAFVDAVRGGDAPAFKSRFRDTDVLLIDDVQFLAEKVKTEEEFFHTFNALYESGAQLVFTSDRRPADLASVEKRLRERFESGLVVDVEAPDPAARMTILRKRVFEDGFESVADEALEEVSRRVTTSVRALEGALIRLMAYASLRGRAPDRATAAEVLDRLYPQATAPPPGPAEITAATAEAFGLEPDIILARDRRPAVSRARQVAMFLTRELTDESLPAIGRAFHRNHATVSHALERVEKDLQADPDTRLKVEAVRRSLRAP
ncbi:MAG: chromosomal replication initiator protein DnaA [Thermoleophilaceae bacterium]|nr:chromosomal replication initiator protein DnaA [Thermoleophilaceae bacterium]